jgi:hypothetical protein
LNPSGTNDLIITIGGDLTDFQTALDQLSQSVADAGAGIATALGAIDWAPVTDGANTAQEAIASVGDAAGTIGEDLSKLSDAAGAAGGDLGDVSSAAEEAGGSVEGLSDALSNADSAASTAGQSFTELGPEVEEAGEDAEEAAEGFGGLYGQLIEFGEALAITEGLKEFGEEALETYGDVQKASISLDALTGSATQANEIIETLKTTATSDALSFPQLVAAAQKMTALGFSTEQMNTVLQTAADTAAATGNQFTAVASAIDRMALSGTAGARQLATLGISAEQLGAAMGVDATEVTAAFKALDQSDRLDALNTALQKFDGVATSVAQGISGQWQNLKTQFEFVLEGIGEAIAPVVSALLSFAQTNIVPYLQAMVNWFNELPAPIKDAAVAAGLLVAAMAPLAVAIGGFALAVTGASTAIAELTAEEGLITAFGATMTGLFTTIGTVTTAVSEGLVGALTAGEAALLGFAAAGAAVAAAFVFYDQIKQLATNISNLTDVLSADVPWWNDLKTAASDVASVIEGAVSSAFTSLMSLLGPVGSAIQSIGSYLPSFSSLWQDVGAAINSIHWSDLIGPIGALNSALKALAEAIQLVTGNYPSMATAGTAALTSIQTANDKLNASMATQASAVTTAATAVQAHAAAATAATPAVTAHAQAVAQDATAAQSASQSFLALQPTLVQLGVTSGTVVNGVEILGSSMRAAQTEAANLGIELIQVTGNASQTGMAANSAGQAYRNATSGLVSWSNSLQDFIYPYKAAAYGIDDLTEGTAEFTAAANSAATAVGNFGSSLSPGVVTASTSAGAAVEGLTGKVSKLGQELQSVQNIVTSFDANLTSFAASADSLGAELDAAFGDTGKGIAGLEMSLTPNEQISQPTGGNILTGTLGSENPATFINTSEIPYGDTTSTYDPTAIAAAATAAASTVTTAATSMSTASDAMTAALQQVTDANAQEAAAAQAYGTPAYEEMKAAADAAADAAATALEAADGQTAATTALTAATAATTTALTSVTTAATTASGVLATVAPAIQAVTNAFVAQPTGIGYGSGVGGTIGTTPLLLTTTPTIGTGSYGGVGGTPSLPSGGITLTVNAGTVVGANGMQQLSQMVGTQLVQILQSRGIRLNRQ